VTRTIGSASGSPSRPVTPVCPSPSSTSRRPCSSMSYLLTVDWRGGLVQGTSDQWNSELYIVRSRRSVATVQTSSCVVHVHETVTIAANVTI